MVYFDVEHQSATEFAGRLKEMNVRVLPTGEHTIRAVTSLAVEADDIDKAMDVIRDIMAVPLT